VQHESGVTPERTELIARNQNTYAKRKREMEKKEKAEQKRIRRTRRKSATNGPDVPEAPAVLPVELNQFEDDVD
jgi:hypothetical protein